MFGQDSEPGNESWWSELPVRDQGYDNILVCLQASALLWELPDKEKQNKTENS